MKFGAFIAIAKLSAILFEASCQSTEILRGFGDGLRNIV